MPSLKLKATLTGVGAVNNCYIYVERLPSPDYPYATPIGLDPKNSSRKEWSNPAISVEVYGNLDLQLNVHAFRGTGWTFKLYNKVGTKFVQIFELEGETGSNPDHGRNVSIERASIELN